MIHRILNCLWNSRGTYHQMHYPDFNSFSQNSTSGIHCAKQNNKTHHLHNYSVPLHDSASIRLCKNGITKQPHDALLSGKCLAQGSADNFAVTTSYFEGQNCVWFCHRLQNDSNLLPCRSSTIPNSLRCVIWGHHLPNCNVAFVVWIFHQNKLPQFCIFID